MEFSNSNGKEFFIFSQKKLVLIFQEYENPEKFLIFQEVPFHNRKVSYISGGTSKAPKIKIYYTFQKKVMNKNTFG